MLKKQMPRSSFGRKFHDLNYFDLDFFSYFLNSFIHLRSSSNILIENRQFNKMLTYFKQNFDNYLFIITTYTPTCTIF